MTCVRWSQFLINPEDARDFASLTRDRNICPLGNAIVGTAEPHIFAVICGGRALLGPYRTETGRRHQEMISATRIERVTVAAAESGRNARSWRCRDSAPSIAEVALNDTKHMLDFRAHFAEPIHAGEPSACRRVWPSPSPPRAPPPPRSALLRIAGVAPVAIDRGVVIADQTACTLPLVTAAVCTRPLLALTSTCAFMPKYH